MGERAAAEDSYRQALDMAQRQKARFWELRAATNLAQLWRDQASGPRPVIFSCLSITGSPTGHADDARGDGIAGCNWCKQAPAGTHFESVASCSGLWLRAGGRVCAASLGKVWSGYLSRPDGVSPYCVGVSI